MAYIPQQTDLQILNQSDRRVYSKIELLSKSTFKVLERLDGELLDDDYSVDADSDIRTTYNLRLYIKNSTFTISSNNKIWLDKYIKVYIGLYSVRLKNVVYYPVGIFAFSTGNYSYDTTTKELSLSCVDMMAELTGDLNGKVSGLSTTIPADSKIRDAIISTLTQIGKITKYRVDDIGQTVPYDLEFNTGASTFDIIKELRDLNPGWETFFDNEIFVCQKYPTLDSDPIILDAETISPLVISEDTSTDFSQIKNVIELWGKCLDADYYTETVTYSSAKYTGTYSGVSALTHGKTFGFLASNTNTGNDYFQVNSLTSYQIFGENNVPLAAGKIQSGHAYVVKYVMSGSSGYFYFCGEYQISAVSVLVSKYPDDATIANDLANNPTRNISYIVESYSPFCRDLDGVGEIREVLSGGDYENIYSEDLATERAEYELWRATDLLDTITLNMIEIPWLGVNQKIEYTSNVTGKTEIYIVKKKSGSSTGGTMTLTCQKFQRLYPWTVSIGYIDISTVGSCMTR